MKHKPIWLEVFVKFAEGQERRWREGKEEERRRDDIFLQFKREEAKKDWKHELKLAEMFATTNERRYTTAGPRVYENLMSSRSTYSAEYPPQ